MRIGHLTLCHGYNYGGILQAWATQEILRSHGHEVVTLDYHPARRMRLLRRACLSYRPLYEPLATASDRLKFAGVDEFIDFRARHFVFSKPCPDIQSLEEVCKDFDAVVVGSDQVWSPDWLRAPYFLDFNLTESCRRISIAACCGRPSEDPAYRAYAARTLGRLDHLSVRNEFTAALVRETTSREPIIICDPTIAAQVPCVSLAGLPQRYIFAYVINRKHSISLALETLRRLKEKTGLPVVTVPPAELKGRCNLQADFVLGAVSPFQWTHLIANASWIATDSFHGTVFSLKHHRNFNVISSGLNTLGRIQSVLQAVALKDRIITTALSPLDPVANNQWAVADSALESQAKAYHEFVAKSL
jgi:hypothetical protein